MAVAITPSAGSGTLFAVAHARGVEVSGKGSSGGDWDASSLDLTAPILTLGGQGSDGRGTGEEGFCRGIRDRAKILVRGAQGH